MNSQAPTAYEMTKSSAETDSVKGSNKPRYSRTTVAIVAIVLVMITLRGIWIVILETRIRAFETKDLTPDLSSYVVGHVYQTVGACTFEPSTAMVRNDITQRLEQMTVDGTWTMFCPVLPNVHEPHVDEHTHFKVFGNDWDDCVGAFREPIGNEREPVFTGVVCRRQQVSHLVRGRRPCLPRVGRAFCLLWT